MRRSDLRHLLLFQFTIIALVLLLAATKFIGTHVLTGAAVERFEAGRGATPNLDPLRQTNVYEHYKVFLNSGDLLYQLSRFHAAEGEFRRAVALADGPAACRARFNLVLAIEQQAKALIDQKAVLSGLRLLERAIATMESAPECFRTSDDGRGGIAERYRDQRAALKAEVAKVKRAQPVQPQKGPPADVPAPGSSDLDRIESEQADASREAQKRKDQREGGTLPPYDGPKW